MTEQPELTPQHIQELADRSADLADQVRGLQEDLDVVSEVAGIEIRTTRTEKDSKKLRRWVRVTAVALVAVLGLALGGLRLATTVDHNTNTIKTVQCQLYSLILSGGYHPENHLSDLGTTPKESLTKYNDVYQQVIQQNNDLGCLVASEPHYITDPAKLPKK